MIANQSNSVLGNTSLGNLRSLFISDVHLGCRYSKAEQLLQILQQCNPEFIYIVGDFIDGWRLQRSWYWNSTYTAILTRLHQLGVNGTQLCYAPGNHDEFLREHLCDVGVVTIQDEFVHQAADARRYVITHGDQFDDVEQRTPWLSWLGANGYNWLLWTDHQMNRVLRMLGFPKWSLCGPIKRNVKHAVAFISNFQERLIRHAREQRCDGIICGHIHTPCISQHDEITYFNTGDWVENSSALVEREDGTMEILHLRCDGSLECTDRSEKVSRARKLSSVQAFSAPAFE